jgi:HD superfamily phosphodiesterase
MFSDTHLLSAENNYKQILEDFFHTVYDEKSLPSHNIDHHRRVWAFAKEIFSSVLSSGSDMKLPDPDELIIACYLHDSGMSVDRGPDHGKLSSRICKKFLAEKNIPFSQFNSVLDAIEFHDRKNYGNLPSDNQVLTILSAADDLDAFGFTGIYRYIEIYYIRSISIAEIGRKIRENAQVRFTNFRIKFGMIDSLLKRHQERFDILDSFFSRYNLQAENYSFGNNPEGYCGAVELMIKFINSGMGPGEFNLHATKYFGDPVIKWYFTGLRGER